ncbi:MAG: LCP family protein [Clostridia bacterium]|nr:LCP family protein [Clostridia bacterium]
MAGEKTKVIISVSSIALTVALVITMVFILKKFEKEEEPEIKETVVDTDVVSFGGSDYVLNKDISTFLAIGLDVTNKENEDGVEQKQADFILLFVFDAKNEKITALHINRDTVTDVNMLALDGTRVKTVKEPIALAHSEGDGKEMSCRNTAEAVSDLLLGVKIDNYASFTMDTVPVINDSVGGITVTIEDDMTSVDPAFIKGATVKLVGDQALKFVRARGGLEDSSNAKRMTRQREYLLKLFAAVREKNEADDEYLINIFPTISDSIVTDCSLTRLNSLQETFSGYTFSGFIDIEGESKIGERFMEFYPDKDALEKTVIDLFYVKK